MSSETPLSTAATEADRVVKRQKVCSSKFAGAVDRLLSAVNEGRDKLSAGGTESVLSDLQQHVSAMGVSSELHDQTKQLHGAIGKLGKVYARCCPLHISQLRGQPVKLSHGLQALEKAFVSDICKAYRPVAFDQQTLDQVFRVISLPHMPTSSSVETKGSCPLVLLHCRRLWQNTCFMKASLQ